MITYPEQRGSAYSVNDGVSGEEASNAIINPSDSGEVMVIHQITTDDQIEIGYCPASGVTGGSANTIHSLNSKQPASQMTAKSDVSVAGWVGYLRSVNARYWQFKGEFRIHPGDALVLLNTDAEVGDTRCTVIWREEPV